MAVPVENIAATLRREADKAIAQHPELRHEWLQERGAVILRFPPTDEQGFQVAIEARDGSITVVMGRSHHPFDVAEGTLERTVGEVLGLTRDLLSPDMRLREMCAGGYPYKWIVETYDGTTWRAEFEAGLLLFNYFGRRSERLFQNRLLRGRLAR